MKAFVPHWAIENNLHWELDVLFKEDNARKRKGNSPQNFNIIMKIALRILEKNKGEMTKPRTRLKALINEQFRTLIFKEF